MQNLQSVGLILVAISLTSCAVAPVAPRERSLTVRTASKQVVGTYAFWTSKCYGRPIAIKTVVSPAHGKLIQADAKQGIRKTSTTPAVCVGQLVDGIRVFYQPNPGYIGPDKFEFRAVTDITERAFRYSVNVVK